MLGHPTLEKKITWLILPTKAPLFPSNPFRTSPKPQRKQILLLPSCRARDRISRPGKCNEPLFIFPPTTLLPRHPLSHFEKVCENNTSVHSRIPGFRRQIHVFVKVTVPPCVHFHIHVCFVSHSSTSLKTPRVGGGKLCVLRLKQSWKGGRQP